MQLHLRRFLAVTLSAAIIGLVGLNSVRAADDKSGPDPKEVRAVVEKAAAYLKTRQGPDGSFAPRLGGPGISAIVAAGLIRNGLGDDPMVQRTLKYLEGAVKADGGIYEQRLQNYTTCVALIAFKEANTKGQYDAVIANAAKFLRTLQFDDGSTDPKDWKFGGVGYDGKSRPDMSNTQFFIDAMKSAGVANSDPALQRALTFINRCQNLPGETNDQPFAQKASDADKGGFVYTPTLGDDKNPRRTPDGGLRSEGAMSYAGLKSFLHAGVTKDDPRVKAAVNWIRKHYTLDENPGQGKAGLFYFYNTFGKAMDALGEDTFVDDKGKKHNWRMDLFNALKSRQKPDGSWANEDRAFMENNPDLATAFAVMALSYCTPHK